MTRRTGGTAAEGVGGSSDCAVAVSTAVAAEEAGASVAGTGTTAGAEDAAEAADSTEAAVGAAGLDVVLSAGAVLSAGVVWGAGVVLGAAAATTTGAAATGTARSAAVCAAGGAAVTGGRTITGPIGGLLAIAGAGGFATMFAPWRGRGTTRRGAGDCTGACAAAEGPGGGAATTRGGAELAVAATGGGATTAGRCGGGTAFTAASACLRSRIAFSASPGFDTFDRSNFGLLSGAWRLAPLLRLPFLKYSRTLSAWSASMELEWVFPDTPIASSASRIGLLLTSSSRARSLIRTLLIRPFSLPCALSCSYQPHRGLNHRCLYYPRKRRICVQGKARLRGLTG